MEEPRADRRLTRIGFRRDVNWFLTALVGFLSVLILGLLLLLQSYAQRTEQARRSEWNALAKIVAESIDQLDEETSASVIEGRIIGLRAIHGIPGIIVSPEGVPPIVSGETIRTDLEPVTRATRFGPTTLFFDATVLRKERQTLTLTAAMVLGSTVAGIVLLFLYLPRITRPIETMLDHAREFEERDEGVEETRYVIDTFRRTIDRLKEQEAELKQLHESEKNRADELELVSATLTRSLSSGFVALDPQGRVVDLNRAAKEILALPPSTMGQGRSIREVLGADAFAQALESAFEERMSLTRLEVHDGTLMVGLTTVPLMDEASRFLGMLAIFTDLTRIRQLENRVRGMQALADLGEISAGIAHEFRNSLSTILGYLKLAKRHDEHEDVVTRIERAEKEASALSSAVDGLLAFSRPIEIERARVDLEELIESVVEGIRESDRESETPPVTIEISGPAVEVEGDSSLLRRAFENLIRNAIEAIGEKGIRDGRIDIALSEDPASVEISDNGVGIDPEEAPRLFLPFQSDKANGLGLGLALARKIVLLHNGEVRLTGRKGIGATVRVEFEPWSDG